MEHTVKAGREEHYRPTLLKLLYVLLADERKPLSKQRMRLKEAKQGERKWQRNGGLLMTQEEYKEKKRARKLYLIKT